MQHPAWISRVRARARENDGVALLEAAFITPVFFILILGIVEIGLAMNDYLALASTVRAGSRVASASGNDPKADLYIALAISRESAAIKDDQITRVVIYKPATFGEAPTATCQAGTSVAGVCNVLTSADLAKAVVQVTEETSALAQNRAVDPAKITFGCLPASPDRYWCPTSRTVKQASPGPDYVGVWMQIEHPLVTGAGVKTMTDQSVIRIEPRSE